MSFLRNRLVVSLVLLGVLAAACHAAGLGAKDLNPVTKKQAPSHSPITLVRDRQPVAAIVMMGKQASGVAELQRSIKEATGAELKIVKGKLETPAIVIGDCDLAREHGLDGGKLPPEGFAIKTCPQAVLIVGNDKGTEWGIYEFLERFVGMRWYWPLDHGRSIPKTKILEVPAVWLEDAPVFRKREIYPPWSESWHGSGVALGPLHTFLRAGNSWPVTLRVHEPDNTWSRVKEYQEQRPEIFQLRSDGTRDFRMVCYGNPRTLATYLETVENHLAGKKPSYCPMHGDALSVSPGDAEIRCYCDHCKKLWDDQGGQYGSASKIVAKFVADLAREVKRRWPDKTLIFLPYKNYTAAPDGVALGDNVEVQIVGMPGMALYKEPSVYASEQANLEKWIKLSGRKVQNWHYSCYPEDRTSAVFQYPRLLQRYYRQNRGNVVGCFVNGTTDHWPRQNITLYCWMKLLWNPDYDVDAAIDEFCRRMFGPAARTMRELVESQINGWENSRWPVPSLSAKAVFAVSYPRQTVLHMDELLQRARAEAKDDALALTRIEYYARPFVAFFEDSKSYAEGGGLRPLLAQKVGENPKIDGRLDDPVWQRAQEVSFVRATDKKQREPRYPTWVKSVWTFDGIAFGFRMDEPTPDLLQMDIKGRDDPMAWWNDNVELLLDVTGKNEGEFYHWIVTATGAICDRKGKDMSWSTDKVQAAAHLGKDFWSVEVYVPYETFAEAAKPLGGRMPVWYGNFTRHRVADRGLKPSPRKVEGSQREYQRMNTTYQGPSNNLQDFAPIKFVE